MDDETLEPDGIDKNGKRYTAYDAFMESSVNEDFGTIQPFLPPKINMSNTGDIETDTTPVSGTVKESL